MDCDFLIIIKIDPWFISLSRFDADNSWSNDKRNFIQNNEQQYDVIFLIDNDVDERRDFTWRSSALRSVQTPSLQRRPSSRVARRSTAHSVFFPKKSDILILNNAIFYSLYVAPVAIFLGKLQPLTKLKKIENESQETRFCSVFIRSSIIQKVLIIIINVASVDCFNIITFFRKKKNILI